MNIAIRPSVARLRRQQQVILKKLVALGPFVEGTLVRLPHKSCRHVAHRLTFKVRGKTQAVYVPVDLVEEVERWHRNYLRCKALIREMSEASLAILRRYVSEQRAARRRSVRSRR
jgi:hypothetical protein